MTTATTQHRSSHALTGLSTLLKKELRAWWGTRQWWLQLLIWTLILNGMLAVFLWVLPGLPEAAADEEFSLTSSIMAFLSFSGTFAPIGVVLVAQGAILDEKRSGTLEWLLSRPVARPAIVLAKFISYSIGFLFTIAFVQGLIGYGQISVANGTPWNVLDFSLAMSLVGLNLLFYLALTLFLGILLDNRGVIIGVPLVILLGYQFILGAIPQLSYISPLGLIQSAAGPASPPMVASLVFGEAVSTLTPLIATIAWIMLFLALAIWRFNREEF